MNEVLAIDPKAVDLGILVPPRSKSDAQRALVLSHALRWPELAVGCACGSDSPRDVLALQAGLRALENRAGVIDCADGGTPLRFLIAQAAITPGTFELRGTSRLAERPRATLVEALRRTLGNHGLVIDDSGSLPIRVHGAVDSGDPHFEIDTRASSQLASSLLLACAALAFREHRPWSVDVAGLQGSQGYFDLTTLWLTKTGFEVSSAGAGWSVRWIGRPQVIPPVPTDWSSAAYLLLLTWGSGAWVSDLPLEVAHPDRAVLEAVASAGLAIHEGDLRRWRITGTAQRGVRASARSCPDLIPTLAALALALPEPSRFDHPSILREKECDRLEATIALVEACGGGARLEGDALTVTPPVVRPALIEFDARDDHRMAMSAVCAAHLLRRPLELTRWRNVEKSFPTFWRQVPPGSLRSQPAVEAM